MDVVAEKVRQVVVVEVRTLVVAQRAAPVGGRVAVKAKEQDEKANQPTKRN